MTNDSSPTFETMLDVLKRNPLKALQLAGKAHLGVNRCSWEVAGIACGIARVFIDDDKHRDDFYDEEFFEDRKRARPDKLLLHVFAYLYGALSGPAYNRASEHARALKLVCNDRDIDVADIPQYIADHGGFDGLLGEQEGQSDQGQDDLEKGAADDTPGDLSKVGVWGQRVVQLEAEKGPTVSSDETKFEDDEEGGDAGDEQEPTVPSDEDAPPSEPAAPALKLLPRPTLGEYLLVRPRAPLTINDLLLALKRGKVTADLALGEVSNTHELYTNGGPFNEVYMDDYAEG